MEAPIKRRRTEEKTELDFGYSKIQAEIQWNSFNYAFKSKSVKYFAECARTPKSCFPTIQSRQISGKSIKVLSANIEFFFSKLLIFDIVYLTNILMPNSRRVVTV